MATRTESRVCEDVKLLLKVIGATALMSLIAVIEILVLYWIFVGFGG